MTAVPDRATREAAAALARLTYCAQLKEVRERRGITLAEIAERTKVNEGLYAALERADVSRWPAGIYRRSFFREYAIALGLPIDAAVSEFLQLFPDDGEQRIPAALVDPVGPAADDARRSHLAARLAHPDTGVARGHRHGGRHHDGRRVVDADPRRHGHGDRRRDLLLAGHCVPGQQPGLLVASHQGQPQARQGTQAGTLREDLWVSLVLSRPRTWVLTVAVVSMATLAPAQQKPFQPEVGQPGKDVVWVPTPEAMVEKMMEMGEITPQDYVIDLGSGDGRNVIAAAKRGAQALGVEYNPDMVDLSKRLAKEAGVPDKALFVRGDMYEADISKATVMALFLLPSNLLQLRPKFADLRPGTRIVSNTFSIQDWTPEKTETVGDCSSWCTAMLYIVPAKVEGTWRLPQGELVVEADVPDREWHADDGREINRAHRQAARDADHLERRRAGVLRRRARQSDRGHDARGQQLDQLYGDARELGPPEGGPTSEGALSEGGPYFVDCDGRMICAK